MTRLLLDRSGRRGDLLGSRSDDRLLGSGPAALDGLDVSAALVAEGGVIGKFRTALRTIHIHTSQGRVRHLAGTHIWPHCNSEPIFSERNLFLKEPAGALR